MLRIMLAGVAAVAAGTLGGLMLCSQASVESAHSMVTIDTTSTSASPVPVPSSTPQAIERSRIVPLPISTALPPVHEVTAADEPFEQARRHKRRLRATARSAPIGVVHHRREYGSADEDGDED